MIITLKDLKHSSPSLSGRASSCDRGDPCGLNFSILKEPVRLCPWWPITCLGVSLRSFSGHISAKAFKKALKTANTESKKTNKELDKTKKNIPLCFSDCFSPACHFYPGWTVFVILKEGAVVVFGRVGSRAQPRRKPRGCSALWKVGWRADGWTARFCPAVIWRHRRLGNGRAPAALRRLSGVQITQAWLYCTGPPARPFYPLEKLEQTTCVCNHGLFAYQVLAKFNINFRLE